MASKKKSEMLTVADLAILPTTRRPADSDATQYVRLPPRAEANVLALATRDEADAMGAARDQPLRRILAAEPMASTYSRFAQHPVAEYTLLQIFAQNHERMSETAARLLDDMRRAARTPAALEAAAPPRQRDAKRHAHVLDGRGPLASYTLTMARVRRDDAGDRQRFIEFYAGDEIDEHVPFGDPDPANFPMMREFKRIYNDMHKKRHQVFEHPVGPDGRPLPLKEAPRLLTRKLMREYRMPPLPGQPTCARGFDCLFKKLAPHAELHGYVGRVFERDLCIDCTIAHWNMRIFEFRREGYAPPQCINTFQVPPSEYGDHASVSASINVAVINGIEGRIPYYDTKFRAYAPITAADIVCYGLQPLVAARRAHTTAPLMFIDEFNVQSRYLNTSIDLPKNRPLLATPHFERFIIPLPRGFWQDVIEWSPWHAYTVRLPAPLVTERVLLDTDPVPASSSNLPVRRLRAALDDHLASVTRDAAPTDPLNKLLGGWAPVLGYGSVYELVHDGLATPLLGTFERAVGRMRALRNDTAWHAFFFGFLDELLETPFRGLPPVQADDATWTTIYMATRARILTAMMLTAYGCCGTSPAASYAAHLFVDTHLDMLASVVRGNRVDDAFWFDDRGRLLTAVYPMPQRVCCYEELPNMATLMLRVEMFADAAKSKQTKSLPRILAKTFLFKEMPHICHVRHIIDALDNGMREHAVVGTLLRLLMRVGLCGNYPTSTGRASLATRLRVALAFGDDHVHQRPAEMTASGIRDWGRLNKYHRHIVLKLLQEHFINIWEDAEAVVGGERVTTTLGGNPVKWADFARAVRRTTARIRGELDRQVRENFGARLDWSSYQMRAVIDDGHMLALSTCFKNIKGRAGFIIKKKMTAVAAVLLVVHALPRIEQDPRLLDVLCALYGQPRVASARALASKVFGRAELPDRSVPSINLVISAQEILAYRHASAVQYFNYLYRGVAADRRPPVPALRPEWLFEAKRRAALHGLHALVFQFEQHADAAPTAVLCAWVASVTFMPALTADVERLGPWIELTAWHSAMAANHPQASVREREVMALHWLQYLGLTRDEFDTIRRWVYEYIVYEHPDDHYRKQALEFGRRSLRAYITVLRYFGRQEFYRTDCAFMRRSADEARRQHAAVRAELGVGDTVATPPMAGMAFYCGHCGRWSTAVQPPPASLIQKTVVASPTQIDELWEMRYIQRVQEARQTDYDEAAPVALSFYRAPGCVPRVPTGASDHSVDFRHGELYCRYAKSVKASLAQQRQLAGCDTIAHGDEDQEEEEEEEEEVADESAAGPRRPSEAQAAVETAFFDLVDFDNVNINAANTIAEYMPHPAPAPVPAPAPAAIILPDTVELTPTLRKALKKQATRDRRMLSMLLTNLVPRRSMTASCADEPLRAVDMFGLWFRTGKSYYGLCCICGVLTAVDEHKITPIGLSCMNHDMPRRLPAMLHPMKLPGPRHCAVCRCAQGRLYSDEIVRVYDANFRVYELPVCRVHMAMLAPLADVTNIGQRRARKHYPLPLSAVIECLGRDRGLLGTGARAPPTTTTMTASPMAAIVEHIRARHWNVLTSAEQMDLAAISMRPRDARDPFYDITERQFLEALATRFQLDNSDMS